VHGDKAAILESSEARHCCGPERACAVLIERAHVEARQSLGDAEARDASIVNARDAARVGADPDRAVACLPQR
jgi:hypothetical protein